MRFFKLFPLALIAIFFFGYIPAQGQQDDSSDLNAHRLWAPFFYQDNGNQYRSSNGAPGPKYWQNRADYQINANLDTAAKKLTGEVTITYTNNSPDDLSFLWLQMDQNSDRRDSRSAATATPFISIIGDSDYTKGYELSTVQTNQNGKDENADYVVNDSRMQIRLKTPLKANGGKILIKIKYAFDVPVFGSRMGYVATKEGIIYDIAQWFPRMAVYDDIIGWNTLPYLGLGEFYLEYGDIDYSVTVPAGMVVGGSGTLQNPKEVYSKTEQDRIAAAYQSDTTVFIHAQSDLHNPQIRSQIGTRTWHFICKQTRDVAWTASDAFVWDAARINLPDGKTALAQSMYPQESDWGRSTEYTKHSIEFYSKLLGHSFTYPTATSVAAGWGGGMEYPGIVFNAMDAKGKTLWIITIHEFGHNWFPMMVGSNERRFMWQDEGLNTFINDECTKWYNNGEFYEEDEGDFQKQASSIFYPGADPLMIPADLIQPRNLSASAYNKTAMGLHLLKDVILGKDRFNYALKTYIDRWAWKHPTPWDFFRTMENAGGEDLSWFWREWFFTTDELDQAVQGVKYNGDDPSKGSLITLVNLDKMVMPVTLKVEEENGKDSTFNLPVEIWQRGDVWTLHYPSTVALKSVTLDPNHQLPDMNSENNFWSALLSKPIPDGITANSIIQKYIDVIGGAKKLNAVKDFEEVRSGEIQGYEMSVTRRIKLPDHFYVDVSLPAMGNMSVMKATMNGKVIKMYNQGKEAEVPDDLKEAISTGLYIFPELNYNRVGYKLNLLGYGMVGKQLAYKVQITDPSGGVSTNYYDPETGLKLQSNGEGGLFSNGSETYGDYQTVNGIKFPFTIKQTGSQNIDFKVDSVKVNSGLKDVDFQ